MHAIAVAALAGLSAGGGRLGGRGVAGWQGQDCDGGGLAAVRRAPPAATAGACKHHAQRQHQRSAEGQRQLQRGAGGTASAAATGCLLASWSRPRLLAVAGGLAGVPIGVKEGLPAFSSRQVAVHVLSWRGALRESGRLYGRRRARQPWQHCRQICLASFSAILMAGPLRRRPAGRANGSKARAGQPRPVYHSRRCE